MLIGLAVVAVAAVLNTAKAFQLPPRTLVGRTGRVSKVQQQRSSIRTESPTGETRQDSEDGSEHFDWHKQWYPVLAEKHTDTERAHAVQLLGKELVVWRNREGRWTCFDDRCPHRAAPLTEGRLEKDGTLMCAYHNWRFDADGKCKKIPQSDSGGRDEAQLKTCAVVYPTQVAQGVIWVWAENGPYAGLESASTQPPLLPEYPGMKITSSTISQRDFPYGWDFSVENLIDPAHVPALHHADILWASVLSTARYPELPSAAPIEMTLEKPIAKEGFATTFPSLIGVDRDLIEFVAPTLVKTTSTNSDGDKIVIMVYNVPTRPGWLRMIAYQANIKPKTSKKKTRQAVRVIPRGLEIHQIPDWIQHMVGNYVWAQDVPILHYQEKKMTSAGVDSSTYAKAAYMPTPSDRGVIATRKWITKFGGGGPPWDASCDRTVPPKEENREIVLDIYNQHTKHCTTCMGALKRVKQLQVVAKTSAVASIAWVMLRGLRGSSSASMPNLATARAMLPGLTLAFSSLAAIKILETLHKAFHFIPFHAQDRK